MPAKKNVIVIDPEMQYERMLHYREKHSVGRYSGAYTGEYMYL